MACNNFLDHTGIVDPDILRIRGKERVQLQLEVEVAGQFVVRAERALEVIN